MKPFRLVILFTNFDLLSLKKEGISYFCLLIAKTCLKSDICYQQGTLLSLMILNKFEKAQLRATIFHHLDGIVTAPTAYTLQQAGILSHLNEHGVSGLTDLAKIFKANEGYLNVALRVLCSQGWLTQTFIGGGEEIQFEMTKEGSVATKYMHLYKEVVAFIPHAIQMEEYISKGLGPEAFIPLKALFEQLKNRFNLPEATDPLEKGVQNQILRHIEGAVAGPLIVALGIEGMFHRYFSIAPFKTEEFTQHTDELAAIVDFFAWLGWFSQKQDIYNFTPIGLFFAKRASAYGVTVSYLPTFMQMRELLFGNPNVLWEKGTHQVEIHVNRAMNVWGSGGAHTTYFKKIDEIIIDLFNKPIHEQPRGFADMGSGNGVLLEHIFEVIWKQTKRGEMLDDYPLFIVGSDFNEAALAATRQTLNQADVWAKVVWGDIGKPELLAEELKDKYDISLGDLLNVRSFLDHNRIYQAPQKIDKDWESQSTGAFCFRGKRLPNAEVEQSLVEHLGKWKPYVKKFGLLVIELHTLDPALTAENLGSTASTAYDATHGFSDQYILELNSFLRAAAASDLHPDPLYQTKYPPSDLATVSINLLKAKEYL